MRACHAWVRDGAPCAAQHRLVRVAQPEQRKPEVAMRVASGAAPRRPRSSSRPLRGARARGAAPRGVRAARAGRPSAAASADEAALRPARGSVRERHGELEHHGRIARPGAPPRARARAPAAPAGAQERRRYAEPRRGSSDLSISAESGAGRPLNLSERQRNPPASSSSKPPRRARRARRRLRLAARARHAGARPARPDATVARGAGRWRLAGD